MFCGWQLMADYERLAELKEGEIVIDLLTERCTYNGASIAPIRMARVLQDWLEQDLSAHRIPLDQIRRAELRVSFGTDRHEGQRDLSQSWADATPYFVSCSLDCSSVIATDELSYESAHQGDIEWPESYSWTS